MTISVANTSNTNSFYYWLTKTNELAHALSNYVITTDSNNTTGNAYVNGTFSATTLTANSGLRGGNSSTSTVLTITSNVNITGNLLSVGSNILVNTSVLSIGNSTVNTIVNSSIISIGNTTLNSSVLSIGNSIVNVTVNSSLISIGNSTINTSINSSSIGITGYSVSTVNVQTSNTDSQVVDYFDKTVYRTAEYVMSLKDNSANSQQASKLLLIHDTGDAYVTEYGVISTNASLGTFSANANSTHCRLLFTPTAANTQIKGIRTNVVV
jgi:hypothetical protein